MSKYTIKTKVVFHASHDIISLMHNHQQCSICKACSCNHDDLLEQVCLGPEE